MKKISIEEKDWVDREWGEIVSCEAVTLSDEWPWNKGTAVPNRNPWEASCNFVVMYSNGRIAEIYSRGWEVLLGLGFRGNLCDKKQSKRIDNSPYDAYRFFNVRLMATVAKALSKGTPIPPGQVSLMDEGCARKLLMEFDILTYPVLNSEDDEQKEYKRWEKKWLDEGICIHAPNAYGFCISRVLFEEDKGKVRLTGNVSAESNRCMYYATLEDFFAQSDEGILGKIVSRFHGDMQTTTISAWKNEIDILKNALSPWKEEDAYIIFEYDIPRLGKRIDAVLLLKGILFYLEFKVGQRNVLQSDIEQVFDYALDLKNFHKYSERLPIIPILMPTDYSNPYHAEQAEKHDNQIFSPVIVGATGICSLLKELTNKYTCDVDSATWGKNWLLSPYSPTPTIIEAARALYESHSVEDITRHEADKVSTDATIACVQKIIDDTKAKNQKSICFVTGVPGAGKTLVGLDIAVKQKFKAGETARENQAVYLSGNGPLVAVLTEALSQDNKRRCAQKGIKDSRREVGKFIQIIHRYRDNMLNKIKNPIVDGKLEIDPSKAVKNGAAGFGEEEHVVIFDEAQRAWTQKRFADYLKRGGTYGNKLKVDNFPMSEAAFLIWAVNQRKDWAVIVCLVGGGQEINTGEAGIAEWLKALNESYPKWNVYISNNLTAFEYAEGQVNNLLKGRKNAVHSQQLHLTVNQRSFRAERLSDFVHALLSFDESSRDLYKNVVENKYPVYLTRDINKARTWLREHSIGSIRTGILVSKSAARFKPQAVTALAQGDEHAVHWFLADKSDVRSSNYLEEAATEIQVQGLELDYACILWDADFRYEEKHWGYYKFNGKSAWTIERNADNQKYMLNAYRVLLTRARQGIVICVPEGNPRTNSEGYPEDATRSPSFYNGTFEYLKSIGIKEL